MSSNQSTASISSPCINKCCLDNDDVCLGCFRSLEEIKSWREVDDATRQSFLKNAKQREQQHQALALSWR